MQILLNQTFGNAIGIKVSSKLTKADYQEFLPILKKRIHEFGNIHLLIEFEDFQGWEIPAIFEDLQFDIQYINKIAKFALVGDNQLYQWYNNLTQPLFRGFGMEQRYFESAQIDEAWRWIHQGMKIIGAVDPKRYEAPVRYGSDLRVLIVGGGVAGLTLAGLLQQRGFKPVVVEKAQSYDEVGYWMVTWPSANRILKGLHQYEQFAEVGVPLNRYQIANQAGEILRSYDIEFLAQEYGSLFSIHRPNLINILTNALSSDAIRMGTTIDQIEQTNDNVLVTFDNGDTDTFDLVVGCDGLHSKTRQLLFGDVPLTYSGLTGWAFWSQSELSTPNKLVEYWGQGKNFALFPAKEGWCGLAIAKAPAHTPDPVENRISRIKNHFQDFGGIVPEILQQLDHPEQIFHDDFYYVEMKEWYRGRVVLLGDAAHGFSPTSGLGAVMAMESAAVLGEELCRTDSKYITRALENYVARRQKRVETLQFKSHLFDQVYSAEDPVMIRIRDFAIQLIPTDQFITFWDDLLTQPI
ncbi:FAD-dependent monooxygenase [Coleofasciculus sp.]|uniref:FAD-dependent monooxygenase n=1 Tax=Coleofasciculus sp. TaxID=3100458 RepID=UPI003A325EE2